VKQPSARETSRSEEASKSGSITTYTRLSFPSSRIFFVGGFQPPNRTNKVLAVSFLHIDDFANLPHHHR
jgi:hypothetical protein